jgi:uncharacterized protein YkwD
MNIKCKKFWAVLCSVLLFSLHLPAGVLEAGGAEAGKREERVRFVSAGDADAEDAEEVTALSRKRPRHENRRPPRGGTRERPYGRDETPPGSGGGQEQKIVDEIIRSSNAERKKVGLRELRRDDEAMEAASRRASELEDSFSHTRPGGRSFDTVFREYGVKPYQWWGENIYNARSGSVANNTFSGAEAVNWWMNSPGHRANILNKNYTHIGVGVYRSGNKIYLVQLFAGR